MIKWIELTLKKTWEPVYINLTAIVAVVQHGADCGAKVYTVESKDEWEVTETAKEVMEKIQEVKDDD